MSSWLRFRRCLRQSNSKGFSFVELLIAIALAAILVAVIYQIFISYRKTVLIQDDVVAIQQAGRNALSKVRDDLMLIGRNAVINEGQETVIFAAPWELMFNGDVTDTWGQMANGTNMTYDNNSKTYTPAQNWDSAAETVRYFVNDPTQGAIEQFKDYSFSTFDREIRREINNMTQTDLIGYGVRYDDGSSGMAYANGERITPLFTYWGDFDFNPTTPDTLWGDSNADGQLSTAEITALLNNSYTWTYTGPAGSVTISNITRGAIYLINSGGTNTNDEDSNNNNILDPGEDFNHNGKLDHNVLGSVLHRIELNITTIAQNPDYQYRHPRDTNYHFRETWVTGAVEPRNLTLDRSPDFGGRPGAPSNLQATEEDCGRGISVTWSRSADDGAGDNDVVWYEIRKSSDASGFQYLAYVPANGYSSYYYFDSDTIFGQSHTYEVLAVDAGNYFSDPSNTDSVTPSITALTKPSNVSTWDTPCFTDPNYGSISVKWTASMQGSDEDPNVTHYAIFRDLSTGTMQFNVGNVPHVRIPASPSDTNGPDNNCTTAGTSEIRAEYDCIDSLYYKHGHDFVWRDQENNPGALNGTLLLLPGTQFDIGLSQAIYYYEVRAYNENTECYSDEALQISLCGDYSESQSFDYSTGGAGGGVARAYFSPPQITAIEDASTFDADGVLINGKFVVYWRPSPNEWCDSSGVTGAQTVDYYYVYRNQVANTYIVDPSSGAFLGNAAMVYPALLADGRTTEYSFEDDNSLYNDDYPHTPWSLNLTYNDMRPTSGSSVINKELYLWDDGGNRSWYDYIVAAANTNGSGVPENNPWAFGASCPVRAAFTCDAECPGEIAAGTAYAEQHSMRGDQYPNLDGNDSIRVFFQFANNGLPAAGAHIELWARRWPPPSDWIYIADESSFIGPQPWVAGSQYMVEHPYEQITPGWIYDYALKITCPLPDGSDGCNRFVLIGATIGSCTPAEPKFCYNTTDPTCPADAGARCDGQYAGSVTFYITDYTAQPDMGFDQTDNNYLWFRIARWQKYPTAPVYPTIPDTEYLIRADGYVYTDNCPPYCDPPNPAYGNLKPRFDTFYGTWESAIIMNDQRRYKFREYVDPGLDYKYTVEIRINHTGDLTVGPRDCNPPYSTCNGPQSDAIYVDFGNKQPCYPYAYTGFTGSTPIAAYQRDYFSGMSGDIDSTDEPWKNYEMTFISFSMWGLGFFLGDYMFKYANNQLETDFDNFFGTLFNWVAQWAADIGYDMCGWEIEVWGVTIFKTLWLWPSCYDDMMAIFNHSFLWSNFRSGACGWTDGQGINGNFMMHWHWRSKEGSRRMVMAFRGRYYPSDNHVDSWMIEHDFGSHNWVYYTIAYEYRTDCEDEYWTSEWYDDQYDNDWWANLLLVCTRTQSGTGQGQMYVYWWSQPDNSGGHIADLQMTMYQTAPKFAWHTIGATFGSTAYYVSSYPYNGKAYVNGHVGFWADPYIDWDTDNYYYDNIRIIPYCGSCPPVQLQGYLPSKTLDWEPGKEQRTKAACASNFKKSYAANDGVPPIRPSALESYKKKGLTEIPSQIDPWYNIRKQKKLK